MLDKEFFLNIEKFASSTKLNGSLFFGRSFKNKDLNKLNDFILSYASNKSFLEIEGGINNWSRELEYPFIFSQIAKYINKSLDENGAKKFIFSIMLVDILLYQLSSLRLDYILKEPIFSIMEKDGKNILNQ